jgi:uncharacterized protein with LGFP repeats
VGASLAAAGLAAALMAPSALATPESDAADAINQAWNAAGGSGSVVGGKDGEVYQVGFGYAQKFTDGKIFFTPESGARILYGPVLDKYESLGGPADSDLGFPNLGTVPGLISPSSRVSTFDASDKPAIFWTPDTGAWAVRGALNAAWDQLGGSAGRLGVPTEDERYDGDLVSQKFTNGELTWNVVDGAFTTVPAEWAADLAGLPVPTDPTTLINLAWRASGGLGGPLGARQGEQAAIGADGAAQGYAGGKIFYSPQTGAHALTGAILSKYESAGGPEGDLGLPIGTESDGGVPNSRVSAFSAPDNPVIFWTPDTGAVVVRGAINAAWDKLGGATGTLGVPTGEQTVRGDIITQKFSGGEISWDAATKQFSTKPSALAADLAGLELPAAVSEVPAGAATGAESGWRWWWAAVLVPLLALLGLIAVWAQRRSTAAPRDPDLDRGFFGDETPADQWAPATRTDSRPEWSAGPGFNSDEDTIDTAPTRVPTDPELAAFDQPGWAPPAEWGEAGRWDREAEPGPGRHALGASDSSARWQLDLGDTDRPRRRHAAEETAEWTDADYLAEADYLEVTEYSGVPESPLPAEPRANGAGAEPWRPAVHLPLADPYQPPEGYFIKANTHSGLYYTPDSALYDNTLPEVWFASEDVAQANGFVRAPE